MNREEFAELRAIDIYELGVITDGFRIRSETGVRFCHDWTWGDDVLFVNGMKITRGSSRCRFTIRRVSDFEVDLYDDTTVVMVNGSGEFRAA